MRKCALPQLCPPNSQLLQGLGVVSLFIQIRPPACEPSHTLARKDGREAREIEVDRNKESKRERFVCYLGALCATIFSCSPRVAVAAKSE